MERYKIYCTEEQIKKALELGAPIKFEQKFYIDWKDGKRVPYPDVERDKDGNPIFIPVISEQMICWIEDQDGIEEITVCKTGMWIWGKNHTLIECGSTYSSRHESSLAAIDAALEYLIENKQKNG